MAYQAMLKTKLIRTLKFHFLLVEEVCVDYGSITQMYLSPLRSEKSLVLQQNLANGDGGQAQKMWMKVGPQTINEVWRLRLSQVTSEISSVRSLHQFTPYVIFLLLAFDVQPLAMMLILPAVNEKEIVHLMVTAVYF